MYALSLLGFSSNRFSSKTSMKESSTRRIELYHKQTLGYGCIPVTAFKYQEDILRYLDKTGTLMRLQEATNKYERRLQKDRDQRLPFLFLLELDIVLLSEISALFSTLLLNEPSVAQHIIHYVVHCAASTTGGIPDLQSEDIQVLLRLKSLPPLPGLVKTGPENTSSGLMLLQGILVAQTLPIKYIVCGREMKEYCRARDTGDQVLGLLVSPSALENPGSKEFVRHQSTLVCFQDELMVDLELGVRYDVPGLQTNAYFQAWNVQRWVSDTDAKIRHQELPSLLMPPAISALNAYLSHCCPSSPWALVAALAAQMAADMFPTPALLHLKLGLILSLASQGRNHPPVPILAVGADTLAAHHLLRHATLLAQRCVTLSSPSHWGPLHGTAHHDEQGNSWLEAGALLLASTGVCFLGDWAKFKSTNLRSSVLSAIESGQVTVDTQRLASSGPAVTSPKFPLRCSVWTYRYWTPGEKGVEQVQLRTLIDVFGMPYLADTGTEADRVSHSMLQAAIGLGNNTTKPYYAVPVHELQQFLAVVSAQPVKLGDKASQLIHDYFVASRRLRSHCLPVGAVATITALSEAHARLAMRHEVNYEDVSAVLCLYETAMVTLFGSYYVTPPPQPKLLDVNSLPLQVHMQMTEFVAWLEKHIKSLLGCSNYNINAEE
ncbi:minichromosome maintenance domain-containing protein 2 isoform X2 [Cryptotermes secundus]|uniref:minichromosome maintenance domain-containing protein 2 isoform X2 n=1 Tax=Cryptotermes secundus TaxID=105785 RepID=UPI001454DA56|nr:minichromosome maintenance domain-containing protein 2 isoform X2 [Cryptotermes secundus]